MSMLTLIAPVNASAYNVVGTACGQAGAGGSATCTDATNNDPLTGRNGVLYRASILISVIGGSVAVIIVLIGGMMYILSNGDQQKIQTAKDTILYAVIGLVVIALAETIIALAVNTF